jgi:hypothetical protein
MRNYKIAGLLLVLVLILVLSACQNESPEMELIPNQITTDESAVAETIPTTAPAEEPTPIQKPVNPVNPDEPYPMPIEIVPYNPYPSPVAGEEIAWEEVSVIISNGDVVEIFQASTLQVTIYLHDGKVLVTTEPEYNAILRLIEECGVDCYDIRKVTE